MGAGASGVAETMADKWDGSGQHGGLRVRAGGCGSTSSPHAEPVEAWGRRRGSDTGVWGGDGARVGHKVSPLALEHSGLDLTAGRAEGMLCVGINREPPYASEASLHMSQVFGDVRTGGPNGDPVHMSQPQLWQTTQGW